MTKIYLLAAAFLLSATTGMAQLTGTKTIPGTYATVAAAVADLNAQGVGSGGVTFNIAAGYAETLTDSLMITATGTSGNAIVFQKQGTGANPVLTRSDAGNRATSVLGAQGDAVIILQGSDFVTFDGINVATTQSGIEYGYYLRKASVTDGCKNITIRNANISLTKGTSAYVVGIYSSNNSDASLVSSATGITITATGGINENLTFTGNTISNVFAGIVVRGYAAASPYSLYDQNVTIGGAAGAGNTIQNFAGNSAATSWGIYTIYVRGCNASYNTIDNAGGSGTAATSTIYGIFFSTNSSSLGDNITNNNSITLAESGTSAINFIANGAVANSYTANSNVFSAGTFASTSASYFINCSSATNNISVNNNRTSGAISKTGAGSLYGCYNLGSTTGGTATYSGNNFSNITLTGASTFYGIYTASSTSQTYVITNDTVSNIAGSSGTTYGIYASYGATGNVVSGNIITGLAGTSTIYGIQIGSTGSTSLNVFNNIIGNLSTSGAATVYGFQYSAGTATNIYTNKIYGLSASNAGGIVYGMTLADGTASGVTNVYNNLIGDLTAPATTGTTDAIRGINITATIAPSSYNLYYNTVYINASSTGANFSTSALYHTTSATATTATLTLNNNILVNSSTASGTGITAAYRRSSTTLTNYASASNNNLFYAGAAGAANVLFYDGTNADQTLSALKTRLSPREAASVTENPPFISTTGTNASFLHISTSTPTQIESAGAPVAGITVDFDGQTRNTNTPDIGADEGNFQLQDITAPGITYTPLGFTCTTGNRSFTATITDASGIPTTGTLVPRVYFRKGASGTWYSAAGTFVSGTSTNSTWSFTISSATLGGVALNDQIFYYAIAQDIVSPANVGSNPSGVVATDVNTVTTHPASPNSYTISSNISGTYTVGTGGAYSTLTAATTALSNSCLVGPVTLNLTDASYSTNETFPIIINQLVGSSAANLVTIKPATGVTTTITGSAATAILRLNGADYVKIDGSNNGTNSKDLTISNTSTSTSSSVVWISSNGTADGATNDTIRNIIVQGQAPLTTFVGIFSGSGTTIGGTAEAASNNVAILNNTVQRSQYGVAIAGFAGQTGNIISGNTIGALTTADYIGFIGLFASNNSGALIANNTISNIITASSNPIGMNITGGFINSTISGNNIASIRYTGTSGYGGKGMNINTGSATSNLNIFNNFISDIGGDGWSSLLSDAIIGVRIGATGGSAVTTGGINFYNNTINLGSGTFAGNTSGTISAGLYLGGGASALNIRNNIIHTNLVNSAASAAKTYAINSAAANTAFTAIDYNDYATTGTQGVLGYIGSDRTDLAAIQTGFGGNTNSKNIVPVFTSATDLHLIPASNTTLDNLGTPIAGITVDIDNQPRSATTPDMGADEFGAPLPIKFEYLTGKKAGTTNALNWKVTCTSTSITMVLERSADARTFDRTITTISATQARCGQPFDAVDAAPINGISYYRLKMIDVDGKVSYSPIVAVMNGKAGAELVGIYPTVVKDQAYLSITSSRSTMMQLSISDMTGKVVATISQAVSSGSSLLPVSTASLASGVYNITGLLDGTRTQTLRFVKQ